MDILVCMKQVIDNSHSLDIKKLDENEKIMNPYDGYALELALSVLEKTEGNITLLTVGEKQAEKVLYQGLACGAKKAYRVVCNEKADASKMLYLGIQTLESERKKPYDIILFGKEASDTMKGRCGPQAAFLLQRGFLGQILSLDEHQVKKQTETGYQIFKWQAPFIFSVERFGKDLRYPSLKSKLQARKKEIGLIEAEEIEEFEQEKLEPFPEKKGCIPVKEDDIHKSVLLLKDWIERRN